jgi:rubrerythrin
LVKIKTAGVKVMGERTGRNLYGAFVGEAKAHFRLLAYAEKAEEEEEWR